MKDCIFCKIIAGEIPTEKIYEDDNFIVVLDINPVTKGHTLIIPKKHFKTLLDAPSTIGSDFFSIAKKIALDLMEKGNEGFHFIINNFKAGQQEVDHIHAHIIPRKLDDGYFYKMVGSLRDKKKRIKNYSFFLIIL